MLKNLAAAHGPDYKVDKIANKNWNQEWESNFQPVTVGRFCRIRADFHAPGRETRFEIVITPKMSFGTGHHATTHLMIQAMEELDFDNKAVLDFGTGTGILAILAEKLGAKNITACDNDPWSLQNAAENKQKHDCRSILLTGEEIDSIPMVYDIILANINRNVLVSQMPVLATHLKPGGLLLMSGFLQDDLDPILNAASNHKMMIYNTMEQNKWILAVVKNESY
jgi:ribosomal protein L11 methyltransferase